jgi:hypothetical protein
MSDWGISAQGIWIEGHVCKYPVNTPSTLGFMLLSCFHAIIVSLVRPSLLLLGVVYVCPIVGSALTRPQELRFCIEAHAWKRVAAASSTPPLAHTTFSFFDMYPGVHYEAQARRWSAAS